MRALVLLLAPLVTGCIVVEQGDGVRVPCCLAGEGARLSTLSVVNDDALALSLTSADGPTACALAEDDGLELGFAGSQLFLRVDGSAWSWSCPEGVYPLGGRYCDGPGVGLGCARLRTWDLNGRMVEEQWAVSGAVIVEDEGLDRCRFEIEAVLPGGEVLSGEAVTDDLDLWGEDAVCKE